nr:MAG TPA: hypothetical protein [Caudoviricetes sp.]
MIYTEKSQFRTEIFRSITKNFLRKKLKTISQLSLVKLHYLKIR